MRLTPSTAKRALFFIFFVLRVAGFVSPVRAVLFSVGGGVITDPVAVLVDEETTGLCFGAPTGADSFALALTGEMPEAEDVAPLRLSQVTAVRSGVGAPETGARLMAEERAPSMAASRMGRSRRSRHTRHEQSAGE
jgi:hypothetical protein